MQPSKRNAFEEAAAEKQRGIVGELFAMLRENKKWWLIPMVLVLLALGLFVVFGSSGLAVFIYAGF